MMATMPDLTFKKLDHDSILKVKITATNQLKIRVVLAQFFIRMAARSLGCGIKIETDE
jgi:hypothetical protein